MAIKLQEDPGGKKRFVKVDDEIGKARRELDAFDTQHSPEMGGRPGLDWKGMSKGEYPGEPRLSATFEEYTIPRKKKPAVKKDAPPPGSDYEEYVRNVTPDMAEMKKRVNAYDSLPDGPEKDAAGTKARGQVMYMNERYFDPNKGNIPTKPVSNSKEIPPMKDGLTRMREAEKNK